MPRLALLPLLPLLTACGLYFPPEAEGGEDDDGEVEDVFVAVGDEGALLSSPDGVTWTTRTSGVGGGLRDVTFGAGTYIAVGQSGKALTSDNGLDWTAASTPSSRDLLAVTWHKDLFYAVGGDYSAGAETLVSVDGTTWTRPEIPQPQHVLTDLASDGITLLATGSYDASAQTFGLFTWQGEAGWIAVDGFAGGAKYDAINTGYPAFTLIGAGAAATSADGATWVPTSIFSVPPMHGLVYASLGWIAVGDGGGVLTSLDGVAWASHATPATQVLRAVTTDGGQFIAVGDGGTILASTDAATWSVMSSPLTVNLHAVAHPRE